MNRFWTGVFLVCLTLVAFPAACAQKAKLQLADRAIDVEIRRTGYGIPHIKAQSYTSLGYGIAYAYAQDNICLLADRFVTIRGERSLNFGAEGTTYIGLDLIDNYDADVYMRGYFDDALITQQFNQVSGEAKQLIAGYVRGYNRYLADTGLANLPAECRNAEWVRPITILDMQRNLLAGATLASGAPLAQGVAMAAPPGTAAAKAMNSSLADLPGRHGSALGSNGVAIGSDASENGRGVLLGNPHFPWDGPVRFYEMHLTIPDRLNVMGGALPGFPMVNIGFNETVAWTHTVSTGARFTLYELSLAPGNPTAYMYEGQPRAMQSREVVVPVKESNGDIVDRHVTLYRSHFGPMVIYTPFGLSWSATKAYALKDANIDNVRMIDQWLDIGRAGGVPTLRTALEKNMGLPWVNTIAADNKGRALYADISVKPYVDQALFDACAQSALARLAYAAGEIVMLDGTRADCEWKQHAGTTPDLLPADQLPSLMRRDFVQNSNDSYWLSNPAQPLSGFSPIVGRTGIPQSLRTRVGLTQIADRFSNADGLGGTRFTDTHLQQILFGNRNYAAELTVEAFVPVCRASPFVVLDGTPVGIGRACETLANWDRRNDSTSVGPHLFREFWSRIENVSGLFATPFDASDPIHTPRDLNVGNAAVRTVLLRNFARSVKALQDNGIALNAPWGQLLYQNIDGVHVPMHGGQESEGVYNKVDVVPGVVLTPAGYTPIGFGSSYIQTVGFDGDGPVAHAILSFSLSSHDDSPHYADQTIDLFSQEKWLRLPFREQEITADPAYSLQHLVEH